MDEIDHAQDMEQQLRELQLRSRRPTLERTGYCWNCDALLIDRSRAFCDSLCSEDWHRRNPDGR